MTENVVSFSGGPIHSDRRAQFCAHVAAVFDLYLEQTDEVPDALVVVMGGITQPVKQTHIIQGDSRGGGLSMLALAQAMILREIVNPSED